MYVDCFSGHSAFLSVLSYLHCGLNTRRSHHVFVLDMENAVAGLVCASMLAERGIAVKVFEMGRGPGGRMSQRRYFYHFYFMSISSFLPTWFSQDQGLQLLTPEVSIHRIACCFETCSLANLQTSEIVITGLKHVVALEHGSIAKTKCATYELPSSLNCVCIHPQGANRRWSGASVWPWCSVLHSEKTWSAEASWKVADVWACCWMARPIWHIVCADWKLCWRYCRCKFSQLIPFSFWLQFDFTDFCTMFCSTALFVLTTLGLGINCGCHRTLIRSFLHGDRFLKCINHWDTQPKVSSLRNGFTYNGHKCLSWLQFTSSWFLWQSSGWGLCVFFSKGGEKKICWCSWHEFNL